MNNNSGSYSLNYNDLFIRQLDRIGAIGMKDKDIRELEMNLFLEVVILNGIIPTKLKSSKYNEKIKIMETNFKDNPQFNRVYGYLDVVQEAVNCLAKQIIDFEEKDSKINKYDKNVNFSEDEQN
jgi:hypothetical protein